MKKSILSAAIILSFGANATDVIISGNDTLIQDSGILSNSGFQITDNKFINVDGVLETNIPSSFYFRVGQDYANTIVYDKKAVINPFANLHTLHQFLNNQSGKTVLYKNDDKEIAVQIHKVIGNTIFLRKENGEIFTAKLEDIHLNDSILNAKNFNLNVSFNNKEIKPEDTYHYSYFANGFNWYPNYTVTMKDDNKMDFTFYGNISNNTQSDLNNIDLTLMTQENTMKPVPVQQNRMMMKSMLVAEMSMEADNVAYSSMGNVSSQDIEDLTAYKVQGKVDLKSGIASNVLIKEFKDVTYEKNNNINIPELRSDSITYLYNRLDRLNSLTVKSINGTDLVVDYKDNKDMTKDYLPQGEVNVMKLDESKGKEILIPYNKSYIHGTKKEDFVISLPKNKNVKYLANIASKDDIVMTDEKYYGKKKEMMVERNYRVTISQYFENNSDKAETFVLKLPESQGKTSRFPNDYKLEILKDEGQYKYSITIPANSKKETQIVTELTSVERKR